MLNTCWFNICLGHCYRKSLHYVCAVRISPMKRLCSILCCFCFLTFRRYMCWSMEVQEKSLAPFSLSCVFKPNFTQHVRAEAISRFGHNLQTSGWRVTDLSLPPTSSVRGKVQISFAIPLSSTWHFWQPFSSWITAPLVSDALCRISPTAALWNKCGSSEVSWLPTGLSVAVLSDNNTVFLFSLCCGLTSPCVMVEINSAFHLLTWDSITALSTRKLRFTIIWCSRIYYYYYYC